MNARDFVESFTLQVYAHLDDPLFEELKYMSEQCTALTYTNQRLNAENIGLKRQIENLERQIKKPLVESLGDILSSNPAIILGSVLGIIGVSMMLFATNNYYNRI